MRIDEREHRLTGAERRAKLLQARGHHGVVGRRERVKIERRAFLLQLRLGVADGGRATATSLAARFTSASAASCAVFAVSAVSTEVVLLCTSFCRRSLMLLALAKFACAFCDACRRLLEGCFGLLGGGFGPADARRLLAVVEAGQNRTLGDAVADIGAKLDQHAGDLEADLGGDARLDGAEAEDLDRHIALNGGNLHLDRTQIGRPGAEQNAGADDQCRSRQDETFPRHGFHPATRDFILHTALPGAQH